jgi:putative restriction endonuclease
MATNAVPWKRAHTLAAFHLYTLLPFGKLSQYTAEVQELARWEGRTPSSLAMKLVNFASLDPQITRTGRVGLRGATLQDRALWAELQDNWDRVAEEAARAYTDMALSHGVAGDDALISEVDEPKDGEGLTRSATVQVRINQARFRKAVVSSYDSTCCISGLRHPKLVVASHIIPWSQDTRNRLNPRNGLCLSALHDRAFDQGLLTVMPDFRVRVSPSLVSNKGTSTLLNSLVYCDGQTIAMPQKFAPAPEFLAWHAEKFGFL